MTDKGQKTTGEITRLLMKSNGGDPAATSELYKLIYAELRALAASFMRRERPGHTLQPTALLHEAYCRLAGQADAVLQSRAHFFAVASQAMRRILIDYARVHRAQRRGGGAPKLCLDEVSEFAASSNLSLVEIDEALTRLKELDPRQSQIVEMHFFGSLSFTEIAGALRLSTRTVERDWRLARAWLFGQLRTGEK